MKKTEEIYPTGVAGVGGDGRFLRHNIYTDRDKSFYETWKVPDIGPSSQDRYHTVEAGEEGLRGITLISYQYYNRVDYWWIIAVANGIFVPSVQLVAGMELRIPSEISVLKVTI